MSNRPFQVGDRVIITGATYFPKVIGTITTILEGPVQSREENRCWVVDLPNQHVHMKDRHPNAWLAEKHLKHYYDGNDKISWEECIFRPRALFKPKELEKVK